MEYKEIIRNASSGTIDFTFRNNLLFISNNSVYLALFFLICVYLQKIFCHINIGISEKLIFLAIAFLSGIMLKYTDCGSLFLERTKPRSIIAILLPLHTFATVFGMDVHLFYKCVPQLLVLNSIGMALFILFFGFTMSCITFQRAEWDYIICYGLAMASTDGPGLFKLLKGFDTPTMTTVLLTMERFTTLGQSLIFMEIYIGYCDGIVLEWYQISSLYLRMVGLGIFVGYLSGIICGLFLNKIIANFQYMVFGWLIIVYVLYHICNDIIYCSGIYGTFIFSIYICAEKSRISLKSERRLKLFMETWDFVLTGYVYLHVMAYSLLKAIQYFETKTIFLSMSCFFVSILSRGLTVISIYPLVFRSKHYNSCSILAMVFSRKGVVEINKIVIFYHHPTTYNATNKSIGYTLFALTAQLICNNLLIKKIFTVFGTNIINYTRKSNIANCLDLLVSTRNTYLDMHKMDKHLGDADWKIIHEATELQDNSLQVVVDDWQTHNTLGPSLFRPSCQECHEGGVVLSKHEKHQKVSDIKVLILQTQKISFIRQKERGLMLKANLKYLLFGVDMALQSPDLRIDIPDLLSILHQRSSLDNFQHFLLAFIRNKNILLAPRNMHRRSVYKLVNNRIYEIFMYAVGCTSIFFLYWNIFDICNVKMLFLGIPFSIILLDITLKLMVFWHTEFTKGLLHFIQSKWNRFDLCMLVINSAEIVLIIIILKFPFNMNICGYALLLLFLQIHNLRLLKIIYILLKTRYLLLSLCNMRIGRRLRIGYGLALSVLFSYQEVLHMLPYIVDNKELHRAVELEIINEKSKVLADLCQVQYKMNWVAITSKTSRIINTSINTMKESIMALKLMGLTDEFEYVELINRVENLRKPLLKLTHVKVSSTLQLLKSLPFFKSIRGIEELYRLAVFKEYSPDELILTFGKLSNGIYIITDGLASTSHTIEWDLEARTTNYGAIPVNEYICDIDFHRTKAHYIISGNCIGILSFLTHRPCECEVRALVPTKVCFLNQEILENAMATNNDNVHGLYSRLWKFVSVNLALTIMWQVPIYRNLRIEELYYFMEKSFMPNTSGSKFIQIPDSVEDVILIEGRIQDRNTEDIYTAPCYIPRSVRNIVFMRKLVFHIEPQLLIIPLKEDLQRSIFENLDYEKKAPANLPDKYNMIQTLMHQKI